MLQKLDSEYWDKRYKDSEAAWDIGYVSTPIKEYIDQLADKNIKILIPGCGNAYEAEYLLQQGFTDITVVDISPTAVNAIKQKLSSFLGKQLNVLLKDFFELDLKFDLVIEQTFFCALDPSLRKRYADKMYELLKPGGSIVGVLFNTDFEGGPPFGGSSEEYKALFSQKFDIRIMENCYNSIPKRTGNEVFIKFRKN